jgi:DNA-binding transcriptional LysR family regulator
MDSKLLVYLAEVVDCGSISKATIKLNITQPTLTRNMKILEELAGGPVLRRTRHGVSPTDLGLRLAKHGRDVRAVVLQAHDTLHQHMNLEMRELTIGTSPIFTFAGLTGFFHHFPPEQHKTPIRFVTDSFSQILRKLEDGTVDLAILTADEQLQASHEDIVSEHLFIEKLGVFAGAKSPLLQQTGRISIQTLQKQTWAVFGSTTNQCIASSHAMKAFDLPAPRFVFKGDLSTPLELMKTSDVLMLLPTRLASYLFRNDKTGQITVDYEFAMSSAVICSTGRNLKNQNVVELMGKLKQHFQLILDATQDAKIDQTETQLVDA